MLRTYYLARHPDIGKLKPENLNLLEVTAVKWQIAGVSHLSPGAGEIRAGHSQVLAQGALHFVVWPAGARVGGRGGPVSAEPQQPSP